jgi:hypothetical protein
MAGAILLRWLLRVQPPVVSTCHLNALLSTQEVVPDVKSQIACSKGRSPISKASLPCCQACAGLRCNTLPASAAPPLTPANGCENASAAVRPAATALLAMLLRVPARGLAACCAARPPSPLPPPLLLR